MLVYFGVCANLASERMNKGLVTIENRYGRRKMMVFPMCWKADMLYMKGIQKELMQTETDIRMTMMR